jgi:hypothetical protein
VLKANKCIFEFSIKENRQFFSIWKSPKNRHLGSMLWSQFTAIFDNFWLKIGVFLKNQCYDQNFAKFGFVLSQKTPIFPRFFGEKFFKIITSVPGPNPTTTIYNAGVVNVYNATDSLARFESLKISLLWKTL